MPKTTKGSGDGGKRHPLNMRTTKEIRDRLEKAAAESGRSLAQEVESRLDRSFEWQDAFGEARKILADAQLAVAKNLQVRLREAGWTPVTGVGGTAWFEPGTDPDQWRVENTSSRLIEEIAERAAIRAIQKVTDNAR